MSNSIHRMKNQGQWIVFFVAMVLGVVAGLSLYVSDKYSLISYGDSVSHMVIARRLVDWIDPGWQQLGTVWLPLPHLLFLPFTLIDSLFVSGFAGAAVNIPCLAMAAAFLYKLNDDVSDHGTVPSAFVAPALFILNLNVLYLGLTPMTEAPFLAFFTASTFFFHRWRQNPERLQDLAWCSGFISLATLTRYEAWIIPPFLIAFAIMKIRLPNQNRRTRFSLFFLSLGSCLGILLWLVYNRLLYGNMLEFAGAQFYSAASQALERPIRQTLFLQPINTLTAFGSVAQKMFGLQLLAAGAGLFILTSRRGEWYRIPSMIYLLLPSLFTMISLFLGVAEMSDWFNARYLVLFAPAVVTLSAFSLNFLRQSNVRHAKGFFAAAVFILLLQSMITPLFGRVLTYSEAKSGFDYLWSPSAVQAGEKLGSLYDHGIIIIMTGSAQEQRILVTSGIPLRKFDELIQSSTWKESYGEPWSHGRWLVMSKSPDSDAVAVIDSWRKREKDLADHYSRVFENEYFLIFVAK